MSNKSTSYFLKLIRILATISILSIAVGSNIRVHSVINRAEIESTTTFDPNTANNVDQTPDIPITFEVDLTIQANVITQTIYPGLPVEFNFEITNNGPSSVTTLDVSGYDLSGINSATYILPQGVSINNGVITGLDLDANESFTLTVNAVVDSTVESDLSSTAVVTAPNGVTETVTTNNDDPFTLPVTPAADLSLEKTTTESTLVQGTSVKYTLVGTNNGPSTAQPNIIIEDTLPAELSYQSVDANASSPDWSCNESNQVVTCTNPNAIADQAQTTLVINVLVN
ncbi:MAG: hypothetical protein AAGF07_05370 [Patescibacteria group bacterium]